MRTIASWFLTSNDREAQRLARRSLVFERDIYLHFELLTDMFAGVSEGEISEILEALRDGPNGLSERNIRRALLISENPKKRKAIRRWADSQAFPSRQVVDLAAETFPQNSDGFTALMKSEELQPALKADVLASYLENVVPSRPYWLREKLVADPRALQQLLQLALENHRIELFINQFVSDLSALPVTESPELLHIVLSFRERAASSQLIYLALKDAFQSQFQGTDAAHINRFLRSEEVSRWIERAHSHDVVALVVQSCHRDPFAVARAWQWIAVAPDAFFYKHAVLLDSSDSLLGSIRQVMPEQTVASLVACVLRTKSIDHGELHYEFCSRLLRFAFENSRHPLGPLIPVTFPDVYSGVVKYERRPSFFMACSIHTTGTREKSYDPRLWILFLDRSGPQCILPLPQAGRISSRKSSSAFCGSRTGIDISAGCSRNSGVHTMRS